MTHITHSEPHVADSRAKGRIEKLHRKAETAPQPKRLAKTIAFADQGQDFLEWDLDSTGKVVACRPFQASIWIGHTVRNHERITVGSYAVITVDGTPLAIRYPLERVTPAPLTISP
ncbi:hypothetical protein [Variovorax boronicumulans]